MFLKILQISQEKTYVVFPVNIAKFLRTPILKYIFKRLLLYFWNSNYNNVIYILSENFIFSVRIYKIFFYLISFLNFSSTEFVLAFAFFWYTISNISHNISNVSFFSSLNRLNAFSHYQKFVLIRNAQNLSSDFF